jgi:hypothetical protein
MRHIGAIAIIFSKKRRNDGPKQTKILLTNLPKQAGVRGFQVLSKRWIVARALGWFGRYRRFSKDHEYLTRTSEAMIRVAMILLMVLPMACMASFSTHSRCREPLSSP